MKKYQYSEEVRRVLEQSRIPFAIYQFIDKRVEALVISSGLCSLFGYDDMEKAYYDMNHNMYVDTHPDDIARIANAAFRFATEGGKYEVVYRTKNKIKGGYTMIHAIGEHVYTDTEERLAQVWYTDEGGYLESGEEADSEVTNRFSNALHEESIIMENYHDFLTGLPNMTYFFDLVKGGLRYITANGGSPVILYMDLSGMKFYNHRFGFSAGDRLLRNFGHLLSAYFHTENCSRFGQDHFAVLAEEEGIEDKLQRFFKEWDAMDNGQSLPIRVGIYSVHMEHVDISTACDRAKLACDSLRNNFASSIGYFTREMLAAAEKRHYIVSHIDEAIKNGWIKIYYQPIVRAINGRVCDEEALARWIDPVHGFLSPDEFIPYLEDSRLIYKLDLFVVDSVLRKIKEQQSRGLYTVPQSVNLSRYDFDCCDVVEEIRRRVDESGIGRDKLTVEITESVIGSNFEFMKKQINRFRELGFQVWMDDFGSGYSSLDVLKSLQFDLIKFDMRFLQQPDDNENGKIILTELMRMATALGIETVCEGVEEKEQVSFLRDIGCSKLQGYYYSKPIPLEVMFARYENGTGIGFENPLETAYYETVGRVNLFDLAVLSHDNENEFQNYFDGLPMAVMEINGNETSYIRSNPAYREFCLKYLGYSIMDNNGNYIPHVHDADSVFMRMARQCCEEDKRAFVDDKINDNVMVHFYVNSLDANPVTGSKAVAIAILSVMEDEQGTTYANIARALAADYFNLFYVDLETEKFIEYSSAVGQEVIALEQHGDNFFAKSREDALWRLYEPDVENFISVFAKENIIKELDEHGFFVTTYRLLIKNEPVYVNMKAVRMSNSGNHIIIGVSGIDAQMKEKEALERMHAEQIAYARIAALSGNYICMYIIDPVTGSYSEYSATTDYDGFGFAKSGNDFFAQAAIDAKIALHPEDLECYYQNITKENVMKVIAEKGLFVFNYRLGGTGGYRNVALRATLVKETDGDKLIVGVFE